MERIGNERTGCSNIVLPVAAGQEIMPGTMVALNADGYAVPASKAENLIIAGVAQARADNRLGADGAKVVKIGVFEPASGDNGAKVVGVRRGAFVMANDKTIKQTDLLKTAYVSDATTLTLTAEGSSPAGQILEVMDDGVTVKIG